MNKSPSRGNLGSYPPFHSSIEPISPHPHTPVSNKNRSVSPNRGGGNNNPNNQNQNNPYAPMPLGYQPNNIPQSYQPYHNPHSMSFNAPPTTHIPKNFPNTPNNNNLNTSLHNSPQAHYLIPTISNPNHHPYPPIPPQAPQMYQNPMDIVKNQVERIGYLERSIDDLIKQNQKINSNYDNKCNQLLQWQEQNTDLNRELSKRFSIISELEGDVVKYKNECERAIRMHDSQLKETEQYELLLDEQNKELQIWKENYEKVQKSYNALARSTNQIDELTNRTRDLEIGINTQRKMRENAENTVNQLEGEIRRLHVIINQFERRKPHQPPVDYGLEIVRFENEIVRYANEIDSLRKTISQHGAERDSMLQEISALRDRLAETERGSANVNNMHRYNKELQEENNHLKYYLDQQEKETAYWRTKAEQKDGLDNYTADMEKRVRWLAAENQRLNQLILGRIKDIRGGW